MPAKFSGSFEKQAHRARNGTKTFNGVRKLFLFLLDIHFETTDNLSTISNTFIFLV